MTSGSVGLNGAPGNGPKPVMRIRMRPYRKRQERFCARDVQGTRNTPTIYPRRLLKTIADRGNRRPRAALVPSARTRVRSRATNLHSPRFFLLLAHVAIPMLA